MTIRTLIVDDEAHARARIRRGADFQVCRIASFQTCAASVLARPADLAISDTAGLETCATVAECCTIPRSQAPQVVVMSATEASAAGLPLPTAVSAKPKCC